MLTPGLQAGHPWQSCPISSCLQSQLTCGVQLPKGEEASATGGGINNWDTSMGTQWDGEYGPWELFWSSIQGLVGFPGVPQWCGSPVLVGITAPFGGCQ